MDSALKETLSIAVEHYREGRIEAAEEYCREVLRQAPSDPDALHFLGLLLHTNGRSVEAEEAISKAVKVHPGAAVYYENLAIIQRERRAIAAAIATCRAGLNKAPTPRLASILLEILIESGEIHQALSLIDELDRVGPPTTDSLAYRALCLSQLGQTALAHRAAAQSGAVDPSNGDVASILAEIEEKSGNVHRAITLWRRALAVSPDLIAASINLGLSLFRLGDAAAAILVLSSIQTPADTSLAAAMFNGRAAAHRALGEIDSARKCLYAALSFLPGSPEYLGNLSEVCRYETPHRGLLTGARALAANPLDVGALNNYGLALVEVDLVQESLRSFRRAIALSPAHLESINNAAGSMTILGLFLEALALSWRFLAIAPESITGRYGLSRVQIMLGDLRNGWRNYDWRIRDDSVIRPRPFGVRFWQGEPIVGKLLIWGEQGLGDEIIFGTILSDVVRAGIRAVVECDSRLIGIFSRSYPSIEFIPRTTPPDRRLADDDISAQIPMGSLARWFRPDLSEFESEVTKLTPRPELVDYWQGRLAALGPGPKIGFAWRSRRVDAVARRDHPPVLDWAPVLAQPEATFVSLQYAESESDIGLVGSTLGVPIHTFAELDLMNDLEAVLALSAALDMTVATQSTAFCLPAATGKPVWLFIPEDSFWLLGARRFPWLPNVRTYIHRFSLPRSATMQAIGQDLRVWLADWQSKRPK